MNSKKIGNRYENNFAKRLSLWWFNNKITLSKHINSGTTKDMYVGDIIPGKLETFTWKKWPFFIEVKGGYKNDIPTFYKNYKLNEFINETVTKLTEYQYIPILILQFHKKTPIFFTTLLLNHWCQIAYSFQDTNKSIHVFYWYLLKDLEKNDFLELISKDLKNILVEE